MIRWHPVCVYSCCVYSVECLWSVSAFAKMIFVREFIFMCILFPNFDVCTSWAVGGMIFNLWALQVQCRLLFYLFFTPPIFTRVIVSWSTGNPVLFLKLRARLVRHSWRCLRKNHLKKVTSTVNSNNMISKGPRLMRADRSYVLFGVGRNMISC